MDALPNSGSPIIDLGKKLQVSLQKQLGMHRQLLETVREEALAIETGEFEPIRNANAAKEMAAPFLWQEEQERLQIVRRLAPLLNLPAEGSKLNEIVLKVQDHDHGLSESLRTTHVALNMMIQRIQEQLKTNRETLEGLQGHIENMKKQILGQSPQRLQTYNASGQKNSNKNSISPDSRILEAEG